MCFYSRRLSSLLNDSPAGASSGATSNGSREDLNTSQSHRRTHWKLRAWGKSSRNATAIDRLPDDVLLDIFDFCRIDELPLQLWIFAWKWDRLVHVCRRWRQLIFASPHRLHIQLCCTPGTPVRKHLSCWPAFPIIIDYGNDESLSPGDEDNIIAALEHSDRVCALELCATSPQLEKLVAVMQKPYPTLKRLVLSSDPDALVLPGGFLGGSASRLRELELDNVAFPAFPALLSSTSGLAQLHLYIPASGYISPDAMVAGLAVLPCLLSLHIALIHNKSHLDEISLPHVTRTVLPALRLFLFCGECKYLEDFVTRIDTPQLKTFGVFYSNQNIDLEVLPQVSGFINRSESLKRILSKECQLTVDEDSLVSFHIDGTTNNKAELLGPSSTGILIDTVGGEGMEAQISRLTRVLSWVFPVLPSIVHCTIDSVLLMSKRGYLSCVGWLQLLRQFSSVQTLFVDGNIAGLVSHALKYIEGEMITEVLPALNLLCLEDEPMSSVHNFIAARRENGHPVTYVKKKVMFKKRLMAYS